jgi:hypothetical protein
MRREEQPTSIFENHVIISGGGGVGIIVFVVVNASAVHMPAGQGYDNTAVCGILP